ncbi:MAG: cytochrome C oxidase subunit II [Gemmatimonadaceae bacterium]
MEQRIAVVVSTVLGVLLLATFALVARSAGHAGTAEEIATGAARWRRRSLWGLAILFVPTIAYSLTRMPYPVAGVTPVVTVLASGQQWSWSIAPDTVPAGALVEIRVTGADVNHGFGIYDTSGRLVTQTQAMPGYTNVIRYTFSSPGTYRILCLEYCGLGHHTMASQLVVTAER